MSFHIVTRTGLSSLPVCLSNYLLFFLEMYRKSFILGMLNLCLPHDTISSSSTIYCSFDTVYDIFWLPKVVNIQVVKNNYLFPLCLPGFSGLF